MTLVKDVRFQDTIAQLWLQDQAIGPCSHFQVCDLSEKFGILSENDGAGLACAVALMGAVARYSVASRKPAKRSYVGPSFGGGGDDDGKGDGRGGGGAGLAANEGGDPPSQLIRPFSLSWVV